MPITYLFFDGNEIISAMLLCMRTLRRTSSSTPLFSFYFHLIASQQTVDRYRGFTTVYFSHCKVIIRESGNFVLFWYATMKAFVYFAICCLSINAVGKY